MDLNQVIVAVRDFEEAITFYKRLGFRLIVSERDAYARFEAPSGSSTFSVYLAETPTVGDTVLYLEVDDVDGAYQTLTQRGIVFDTAPTDQPYRWRTAQFRDPTGNKLCLYHAGLDRRFPPWRLIPG